MIYSEKKPLGISVFDYLFGAICFFLVIPFGLIVGPLIHFFGRPHNDQKKTT